MKKLLIILTVLCCAFGSDVYAQDTINITPPQIAQAILRKIDHEVSLTDKQSEQVYALLLARSKRFDQAREESNSITSKKAVYEEANEQALTKLKNILTEEQFNKFKNLREATKRQKEKYGHEKDRSDQDIELDF